MDRTKLSSLPVYPGYGGSNAPQTTAQGLFPPKQDFASMPPPPPPAPPPRTGVSTVVTPPPTQASAPPMSQFGSQPSMQASAYGSSIGGVPPTTGFPPQQPYQASYQSSTQPMGQRPYGQQPYGQQPYGAPSQPYGMPSQPYGAPPTYGAPQPYGAGGPPPMQSYSSATYPVQRPPTSQTFGPAPTTAPYGAAPFQQPYGMPPTGQVGSVSLAKGGNLSLTKAVPGLQHTRVGLGWDVRQTTGPAFDLDASVFLLKADGRVRMPQDFIFYNNRQSVDGAVYHHGDNLTGAGEGDDEQISLDLTRMPPDVQKIVFVVSIYEAEVRLQNFGMVSRAFIRVVNADTNQEIVRYDLTEEASVYNCMIFGEVYRYDGEWKFRAIGQGVQGGLRAIGGMFGLNLQ